MRLVSSYTLMAVSQVVLLVGGVLCAAVTSQLARSTARGGIPAPLPGLTASLLNGWMLWILVPVLWVGFATWMSNRPRTQEWTRAVLWLSGLVLVIGFAVWAAWGGVLPLVGAFDTPAARGMESVTRDQLGTE